MSFINYKNEDISRWLCDEHPSNVAVNTAQAHFSLKVVMASESETVHIGQLKDGSKLVEFNFEFDGESSSISNHDGSFYYHDFNSLPVFIVEVMVTNEVQS